MVVVILHPLLPLLFLPSFIVVYLHDLSITEAEVGEVVPPVFGEYLYPSPGDLVVAYVVEMSIKVECLHSPDFSDNLFEITVVELFPSSADPPSCFHLN